MASKTYRASYSDAFRAAKQAVGRCRFFIRAENAEEGTLMATTKPSIWSWGEEVNIKIRSINENSQEIIAQSSPKAQLFDWGRSTDNVKKFFNYLDQELEN